MKSWKPETYVHFKMPPEMVRDAAGNVQYIYHCKACVYLILFMVFLHRANIIPIHILGAHLCLFPVLDMTTARAIFAAM